MQDRPDARKECRCAGRVSFENVTFSYDGNGSAPVLKGVSFTAEPGQTVALLGHDRGRQIKPGASHPPFLRCHLGAGNAWMGWTCATWTRKHLRRNIGVALQETVLFSGTIRDNIRYGRPDAAEEEVIAAAKAAQAHDFILSFPDGYDTQLGPARCESFRRAKAAHCYRAGAPAQAGHAHPG